ncbi:hypothetical protein KC335_g113 [Hortaea werneckii]|nr:hypothetical protein KC335_g113 [Hortaea werneckii]
MDRAEKTDAPHTAGKRSPSVGSKLRMVSSTAGDAWAGVERREAAGVCMMKAGSDDARLIISVIIILIEMRSQAGSRGRGDKKGVWRVCVKTLPEGRRSKHRRCISVGSRTLASLVAISTIIYTPTLPTNRFPFVVEMLRATGHSNEIFHRLRRTVVAPGVGLN